MLKIVYPCRRKEGLDREEYGRRILEGHVPLALRHHPGMRHYTVNLVERTPEDGPEIDSFAELWFADLESYRTELYDSEEGRRAIGEDVATFLGGAEAYGTREVVHRSTHPGSRVGRRTPGLKWILAVRRKEASSQEDFVAHWHDVHVPLVLERMPALVRYVTSPVVERLSEGATAWDGFAELWWETRDTAREALKRAGEAIDADTRTFIDRVDAYSVAEYVQK